jgi:hypothetical protein
VSGAFHTVQPDVLCRKGQAGLSGRRDPRRVYLWPGSQPLDVFALGAFQGIRNAGRSVRSQRRYIRQFATHALRRVVHAPIANNLFHALAAYIEYQSRDDMLRGGLSRPLKQPDYGRLCGDQVRLCAQHQRSILPSAIALALEQLIAAHVGCLAPTKTSSRGAPSRSPPEAGVASPLDFSSPADSILAAVQHDPALRLIANMEYASSCVVHRKPARVLANWMSTLDETVRGGPAPWRICCRSGATQPKSPRHDDEALLCTCDGAVHDLAWCPSPCPVR